MCIVTRVDDCRKDKTVDQQHATRLSSNMTSSEPILCSVTSLPLIVVDRTSPVVVRRRKQATITVTVRGVPAPRVSWYVGPSMAAVSEDRCFQCEDHGGGRHSLVVSSASDELNDGVWVVANNGLAQDSCLIDVKTYRGQCLIVWGLR